MSIWDRTKDSRFILWSRVSFGLMYRLLRRIPSSLHHVLTVTCDTFIPSSASFPAKRLNGNALQFRLLMSINFFATVSVNLIAPRPQCFLLCDKSIIVTGRPSAFCSQFIFELLRDEVLLEILCCEVFLQLREGGFRQAPSVGEFFWAQCYVLPHRRFDILSTNSLLGRSCLGFFRFHYLSGYGL